jgi:hypothetical protein
VLCAADGVLYGERVKDLSELANDDELAAEEAAAQGGVPGARLIVACCVPSSAWCGVFLPGANVFAACRMCQHTCAAHMYVSLSLGIDDVVCEAPACLSRSKVCMRP